MSLENKRITLRAPAKINLYLEVLGERSDGYHEIRSLLSPVSLCDDITLELSDTNITTMVVCNADCERGTGLMGQDNCICSCSSEENLATRAARLLKQASGYTGGAMISIDKHIPVGGGLGGGSADAAAVLLGLNELWGTGLSKSQLIELGAKIGSDVPAMVYGGAVRIEGIGEKVLSMNGKNGSKRPDSAWWVILVNPGFQISTKDVYSRCSSCLTSRDIPYRTICSAFEKGDLATVSCGLYNSLQEPVLKKYPLVGMIIDDLREAGAIGSLLSGSGSSIFGLARDENHAREVTEYIRKAYGYPVLSEVVRLLPDGVMVAHGPLEA